MRLITTTQGHICLKETDDASGALINMQGFAYGELYYRIRNGKIAFYLNNEDSPWKLEVWSINLPVNIDGVDYDEDNVDEAIRHIMADRFQEQIDELASGLTQETQRSVAADAVHDALISGLDEDLQAEVARAQAEEYRIEHQFDDEFAGLHQEDVRLDQAITDVYEYASGVNAALAAEVTRSVAEDGEHDALISALTADLLAEVSRATAEEYRIEHQFDNEFAGLHQKDVEHDTLISALTADLLAETTRATNAESGLQASISSEVVRSSAEDTRLAQALNDEVLRASTAENSLSDRISANTAAIDTKADKASAFTYVDYDHNDKRIYFKSQNNVVVGQVNTTDFVKDGMVSNVVISGNDMVITFNTDAGKEDIVVSLANIFDPNNYYDKSAMDILLSAKQDVSGMSAYALTANTYSKQEVDTALAAKADAVDVAALSGKVETISGDTYSKTESDAKYQPKSGMTDYATTGTVNDAITQFTSALTREYERAQGAEMELSGSKQDVLISGTNIKTINGNSLLGSGDLVISGGGDLSNYYTKTESDNKYQPKSGMTGYATTATTEALNNGLTAHTSNQAIHVTATDKNTWNNKSDFSGNYNDLTNKPTIPVIWAGTQAQFDALPSKDPNTIYLIS